MEVDGMSNISQREKQSNTVKSLNNDYVRSNEEQQQLKQKRHRQKIFLRRRFAVYTVIAAIILFCLFDYMGKQRELLAKQHDELAAAEEKLESAKEQQEMLKLQISKLEDDEYIAKLARKEYFLSEEGEIIFTIPDKEKELKQSN